MTFTNAVATGRFKICKVSSEPTLQGVPFTFTYSYTVNGATVTGSATLQPGQCSGLSDDIPVVDQNGQPIPVTVTEAAVSQVQVSSITVANGNSVSANLGEPDGRLQRQRRIHGRHVRERPRTGFRSAPGSTGFVTGGQPIGTSPPCTSLEHSPG